MKKLGEYIKRSREEKGFSQRELAGLAGISHTEVNRIEDGAREQPSPKILRSLSDAMGASYETMMRLAGYLDESMSSVGASSLSGSGDLTALEIKDVEEYIKLVKNRRKN